jgi:hypothetical protein
MLVKYLRYLAELSGDRIIAFFDGTDPQNVPKANALLTHLYKASCHPKVTYHPANKPFIVLAEVLGSFTLPYTVPEMSLAEQVISLVKSSHLIFALYRIDGPKFLPGQLVCDIQASIKNAIFCVAKTQLVDPSLPFYLLQTGTDRLETRFGTYRTVTSDRNGDMLQMCERAGSAQTIDELFSAHPDWNRIPYRLSLDGRSGVDHTNPASWIGDVIVGNVNLHEAWLEGRLQAERVLKWAGVPFEFDPAVLGATSVNIDLMRPNGEYPGIQVDRIEPTIEPIALEELADDSLLAENNLLIESSDLTEAIPVQLQPLGDEELSIEHLLPPILSDSTQLCDRKGWILVDNKSVHLESAIHYVLGSDTKAKSTDRLRRVCGFTRYLESSEPQSDSVLGDYFCVSELVATLLLANNQVSLAIVRVTEITTANGLSVESIAENTPGITLSGQLLQLQHESGVWYWTQNYISITGCSTASTTGRKRHSVFEFGAHIALTINPELVERNGERTWAFEHKQMLELMHDLWDICATRSPVDCIPSCQASVSFPYHWPNSE